MKRFFALFLSFALCGTLFGGCAVKQQSKPGIVTKALSATPEKLTSFGYNGNATLTYSEDGAIFAQMGAGAALFSADAENADQPYNKEISAVVGSMATALEDFQLQGNFDEAVIDNKLPLPQGDHVGFWLALDVNGEKWEPSLTIFDTGDIYCTPNNGGDGITRHYKAADDMQYPKLQSAIAQVQADLDALPLDYQLNFGCYPASFKPESTALRLRFENRGALPITCSTADFALEKQVGEGWEPLTQRKPTATETLTIAPREELYFAIDLTNCRGGQSIGKYRAQGKAVTSRETLEIVGEYEISADAYEMGNPLLPEMTAENRAYRDNYMEMWGLYCPFEKDFNQENLLTEFDTGLMYYIIATSQGKFEEYADTYGGEIPAEVVESTIQSRFSVDTEQIRRNAPAKAEGLYDYYDPATETYSFSGGFGGGANSVIVTGSWENDERALTLYCDWYNVEDTYLFSSNTTIQPKPDGGFRYIENATYIGPPMDMLNLAIQKGADIDGAPADLENLYEVTQTYVWPLIYTGPILSYSWETPAQIKADDLVCVAAYNNLPQIPNLGEKAIFVDGKNDDYEESQGAAALVEASIQKHFDVTADHLRTSVLYRPDTGRYALGRIWEGGIVYVATAAKEENGKIIIEVGCQAGDGTTPAGTLTLRLEGGTVTKYLSYRYSGEPAEPNLYNPQIWNAPAELSNLDDVTRIYVRPLTTILPYGSWEAPSEIDANNLTAMLCFNNLLRYPRGSMGQYVVLQAPAEAVETAIRKHFTVTSDYLRTSSNYQPKQNTYILGTGWSGAWVAMDAGQKGDTISVTVGAVSNETGQTIRMGVLSLRVTDGNVEYLSYKADNNDYSNLTND